MGLFDSVYVPCAHCGNRIEFQSKADECIMMSYDLSDAPPEIAMDIKDDVVHCMKCDGWTALIDPSLPPRQTPRVNLRTARVKPPKNPDTHVQGMKWWPFEGLRSFDDLMDGELPPTTGGDNE